MAKLGLTEGVHTRLVGHQTARSLPRFDVSQLQRAGMVSETVLSTLGGVIVGSLLTGGFNYLNTQQQVQSANQRQRAEFVAERKVNELLDLSSEISHSYKFILKCLSLAVDDESLPVERLLQLPSEVEAKGNAAGMFLDNEKMEPIDTYHFQLVNAQLFLLEATEENISEIENHLLHSEFLHEEEIERRASMFDFDEFNEAYAEANSVLRWEVAEPIERLR
ncbi:hypothetical protein [Salinilacihabitans rarus]|uniref:hypothetical protein n=1 Tax=Salinilacihabitans rarus TaxID=2961596 RepID=UPI0020C88AA6|nr:hypothetical protein [Salinilacihabitans rarus]